MIFFFIDQTTRERQVSTPVSTPAVASVAHPEKNSLSSSNIMTQANLVYTNSEQDPSVSYWYNYVLAVTDVWQAQRSTSGILANAQNVGITGGTFTVVSLRCCVYNFDINSTNRIISIFSLLMLVEVR